MKMFIAILGMLVSLAAEAQTSECRMLEYRILRQYHLTKTDVCHQVYQECLDRPGRAQDPVRKSRCMRNSIRDCGFRGPSLSGIPKRDSGIDIESYRQQCE